MDPSARVPGPGGRLEVQPRRAARLAVVVVAFDRRQFLREAVESVLAQTMPRSEYEVLVIKNFEDDEIDAYLHREGIAAVRPESTGQGEWIAEAPSRSGAELFAFLDDDDRFRPEKLAAVTSEFARDPRLGYLHHGHAAFGEKAAAAGVDHASALGRLRPLPRTRLRRGQDDADVARSFWLGASFNLSSITVRREVLEGAMASLRQVKIGVPGFLFYAALGLGWDLLHDPSVRSEYRIHPGNATPRGRQSAEERWATLARLARPRVEDAAVILDWSRQRGLDPQAVRPVETIRNRYQLVAAATDRSIPRGEVLRRFSRLVRSAPLNELRDSLPYLFLGLLRIGSVRWSSRWPGLTMHVPALRA
ncbi:MAG TPA: glycosyltransferase family A protein [Thermoplasmata archaeon]